MKDYSHRGERRRGKGERDSGRPFRWWFQGGMLKRKEKSKERQPELR